MTQEETMQEEMAQEMTQVVVKWGFWRKWKWRIKAFKWWGIRGLMLPIDENKNGWKASPGLQYLFSSICTPLTLTRIPYIEKLHTLALDIVLPRIIGYDFVPPETSIDDVILATLDFIDYIEKLKEKDGEASKIIKDMAYTYTETVICALDELSIIEGDHNLAHIASVLRYLKEAIHHSDKKYIYMGAIRLAIDTYIAKNPETLESLLNTENQNNENALG
jgi:hypothetical protein